MRGATEQSQPTFWAAADLAKAGYPVLPLKGKEPSVAGGFYAATTDLSQIAEWISEGRAHHDVGFATGLPSDVVVIEADTVEAYARMEKNYGPPTVRTKRGGHWYFHHPKKGRVTSHAIEEGLDCKGDGGYVACPPSTGKAWTAGIPDKSTLPLLPLEFWEEPASTGKAWARTMPQASKDAAAEVIARFVAAVPQGQRHAHLKHLTGVLLSREVPAGDAEDILVAAWTKVGGDLAERAPREIPNTIRTTTRAIAEGRATGVPKLEEITPGLFGELEDLLGWKIKVTFGGEESSRTHSRNGHGEAEQKSPFGGQGPGVTKLLADAILEEDHFAQDAGGKLYRYAGGTYKQHAERYLRRRVKEILEEQGASDKWSSHRANEVVEYIRADAPELWEKPPTDRVNVANGILHLKSRKLQPHTPDHLSTVQLPVEYDPAAECPGWEKFVAETFPKDAQELAWEIAGDLMTPERSIQKSVLLLGEGSNGKSTALRAYCAFVGSTNVAGLSLQKMEGDRFSVARLVGKLANVCPDLPSTHLTETSVFKALTGGDLVNAEYKYRESFEFPPFARLIFSANHAPRSSDASHAFFRRWLVVPFERTFEESEQTPREELDAKLAGPKELSGVLNKALEALPKLRRKGFTESKSMRDAWEEFRQMTDPLAVWLENFTVEHPSAFVAKRDLLSEYNAHCERLGRAGMTNQAFGRAFRRLKPHIEDGQREVSGKPKTWVWLGLGLRRTEPDPTDDDGARSQDSRDSRDSSNCFGNEPRPSEKSEGEQEVTNKGKRVNHVKGVNDEPLSSNLQPGESATLEQLRDIEKLKKRGFSEWAARREVLAKDHPLSCECEVCR
jgi:P4 family phage/plasmid primase-like protien